MKLEATQFDSNYYGSKEAGNNTHGRYILHNIEVYNEVIIDDDIKLNAMYQTACGYNFNDYSCPSAELELASEAGTDDVLLLVDSLLESDFDNLEYIKEKLEEVQELCPKIDTLIRLQHLYHFLNDNKPTLGDYLDLDVYTQDLDDYEIDPDTRELTLKILI